MKRFEEAFFKIRSFASPICFPISPAADANSPDPPAEQKLQPPDPTEPSLLGQVHPDDRDSL